MLEQNTDIKQKQQISLEDIEECVFFFLGEETESIKLKKKLNNLESFKIKTSAYQKYCKGNQQASLKQNINKA